jgi:hypothetical protein
MSAATRLAAGNVHRDQERLVRTSVDWALIAGSFSQCEMSPFGPKRHLMRRGDLVAPWGRSGYRRPKFDASVVLTDSSDARLSC